MDPDPTERHPASIAARVFGRDRARAQGPGAVDIRLSVEFEDKASGDGETVLLHGSSEVFRGKNAPAARPGPGGRGRWVYPERAAPCASARLHDSVDGNPDRALLRTEVERDTSRIWRCAR